MTPTKKIEFETFKEVMQAYYIESLTQKEPSCFNGMIRVKKYKVTIEEVDEPIEVIHERIQKLWDSNTNMHNRDVLTEAAHKYNYEIKKR